MKKVVLLGDSIRLIGYGAHVAEHLSPDFTVWQSEDNNRYAKYTFRECRNMEQELETADIIHWNNGLWDIQQQLDGEVLTPMAQYVEDMVRLAKLLQKYAKVVIFSTTTPVRKEQEPVMRNSDISAYNAAVVPVLQQMGVVINDLHGPVSTDVYRYICDDMIHLSEDGIALCARLVESIIRAEAEKL